MILLIKSIILFDEVTTSNGFNPIGTIENYFEGTFDGDNFFINNIYINRDEIYQGFFGANYGSIKNFNITGNITGNAIASGVVAYNSGYVQNVFNSVNVKIILIANYEEELNSDHFGKIGGISGENKGGNISNCSNIGKLLVDTGTNTSSNSYVGGIVGWNSDNSIIEYSINKGMIVDVVSTRDTVVGGICGANYNNSAVNNCCNIVESISSLNLYGSAVYCGGIVGINRATLENCYNRANINAISKYYNVYVGGIAGLNQSNIINTYNIGNIFGEANGELFDSGIAFMYEGVGEVENSYYLDTCITNYVSGISKTNLELKNITNLLGDLFKDDYGINNGYPILKWQ